MSQKPTAPKLSVEEMRRNLRMACKGQFHGYYCSGCGVTRTRFSVKCHKCGTYTKEKIIRPKVFA